MTQREFLTAVINFEGMSAEMIAKATEEIEKLNKKNSAKSEKMTETQKANLELAEKILEMLSTENAMLSTEIANALEISTSKATGVLGNLFKEGKVLKVDIKVLKKGTQKGWLLAE